MKNALGETNRKNKQKIASHIVERTELSMKIKQFAQELIRKKEVIS